MKQKPTARTLVFTLVFGVIALVGARPVDARTTNPTGAVQPESQTAAANGIQHIIWVWFENRESTAITAATAPYFTSFAAANVNLTNFYGVSHPSQPNYLDGFSGSNQGVTNDNHFTFPASIDNLARQMALAGKSWRVYAQNFPGSCFDGDSSTGGVDGPGLPGQYVRKHNPAISFESVRLDPIQCANIQPLANFDPTVDFALVVPNMTNDMHDGTTAQGDAFLQAFVPLVTASPDWDHTLLIVTFDEGTTSLNGGGHVYTAAAAPWLSHANVTTVYNHFSVLRTIEEAYGLPFLGSAATVTTMTELLPPASTPTPAPTSSPTPAATATPAPTATATATMAPTPTPSPIPTATATVEPTSTPIPTATGTPSATTAPTATPDATATPPPTPTVTPGATVTPTPTETPAPTPTASPAASPTPSPVPSSLANISTRLRVETGDNAMIAGLIIAGTQPVNVLLRGIGPSLGLADQLANPTLELRDSDGALVEQNDNWQQAPNAQAIIDTTIPPTNDLESAILRPLAPGSYTAILRGANDGTGIGLIEAYDLTHSANARLANISTRGLVQTGNNVLIAGTIVLGQVSQRVLVRAIGPSLELNGKLADPALELRDGNGAILRSNDNWRSDQEKEITATGIPPANDAEAAIVATLPANGASYTAIVSGTGGTTGIAVVEVYAIQ